VNTDYFVKTAQFEGPLDLLLHLIRVHEIDVFAIDIFRLTTEYLDYLRLFEFKDLQQAGEFIEMASNLIEIKTRMLLPQEPTDDEVINGEVEQDPLKTLQQRLIEYELFQRAAQFFHQLPQLGVEIQTNQEWNRLNPLYEHIEAPLRGDAASLVVLYEQMLKALTERKSTKVNLKINRISVEETIEKLYQEIQTTRFALFQGLYQRLESRDELVVNTLAMLELVKAKRLKVYQQEMLGPLWMYCMDFLEAELPINGIVEENSDAGSQLQQVWSLEDLGINSRDESMGAMTEVQEENI
jgi:segregation and condensation protein A